MKDNEINALVVVSFLLTTLGVVKLVMNEFTELLILILACFSKLNQSYKAVKGPGTKKEEKDAL